MSLTRRQLLSAAGLTAVSAGTAAACDQPAVPAPSQGSTLTTVFGGPGSMGGLAGHPSIAAVEVPGFRFGAGQSAFMSAVAADGSVFVGTAPLSDNQTQPTSNDMELGVFVPSKRRFTRLVIPTTKGHRTTASLNPAYLGIGGADVSDVLVVPDSANGERLLFVSAVPFQGWDAKKTGQYPTVGQLLPAAGKWRYVPALSWTADELAARADPGTASLAYPELPPGPRTPRGPVSISRLPRSGHIVVAQYTGDTRSGGNSSGALAVLDLKGRLRGWWQYPPTRPQGVPVVVNPREVVADPSSEADDERFVLISDCRDDEYKTHPFPIQEFSYSASTGRIAPRSGAVRAAQDGAHMETACFDAAGNLYVARTKADGLSAATMAVYPKLGRERGLVLRAPAVDDWTQTFGADCPPDYLVAGTDRGGLVRSLTVDPTTGVVLSVGLSGLLQALRPSGSGDQMAFSAAAETDLGFVQLRGTSPRYVGVRRGAVDATRRILWLPINQLVLDGLRWPYQPFQLNQWLAQVDLRMLLGT